MALPELRKGRGMPPGKPDEDVQSMQNLLQARGHYSRLKTADGRFGNDTEADLKDFQRAVGITPDGICGKVSWAYLLRQGALVKK